METAGTNRANFEICTSVQWVRVRPSTKGSRYLFVFTFGSGYLPSCLHTLIFSALCSYAYPTFIPTESYMQYTSVGVIISQWDHSLIRGLIYTFLKYSCCYHFWPFITCLDAIVHNHLYQGDLLILYDYDQLFRSISAWHIWINSSSLQYLTWCVTQSMISSSVPQLLTGMGCSCRKFSRVG